MGVNGVFIDQIDIILESIGITNRTTRFFWMGELVSRPQRWVVYHQEEIEVFCSAILGATDNDKLGRVCKASIKPSVGPVRGCCEACREMHTGSPCVPLRPPDGLCGNSLELISSTRKCYRRKLTWGSVAHFARQFTGMQDSFNKW